jgi:hypothetical protein
VHLVALEPRHRFGNRDVGQFLDEPLQDATADLGMRHLASTEEDRRLDLVAFLEEALDVLLLELIIVLVDLRAKLDLLHQNDFLVLFRLPRALLFLVLVLAEVHDPADRRVGRRRNLNQVETLGFCNSERLRRRHDAELGAVVVDHADFPDSNAFVHTNAVVTARSSVECDNYLLELFGRGRRSSRPARDALKGVPYQIISLSCPCR